MPNDFTRFPRFTFSSIDRKPRSPLDPSSFIEGASLCGINSLDREGKKAVVPPWVFEEELSAIKSHDAGIKWRSSAYACTFVSARETWTSYPWAAPQLAAPKRQPLGPTRYSNLNIAVDK